MPETLNAALAHAVATWPDKVFMRIDGRTVTFAEFDRDVGRLASGLRDAGLERGDRLVVFMRNSLACLHTWFAANRLGAIWAPINTEFRGLTLEHVCALADAKLFVVDADLRHALPQTGARVLIHGDGPDPLAALYADEPVEPVDVTFADTSGLLFTSGTTGRS
jgi:crotonobetaine/carnitine-CoA ligase